MHKKFTLKKRILHFPSTTPHYDKSQKFQISYLVTIFPQIVSNLEYFPQHLLHKNKVITENIWDYLRISTSKKNSFYENYLQKYGMLIFKQNIEYFHPFRWKTHNPMDTRLDLVNIFYPHFLLHFLQSGGKYQTIQSF